MSCDLAYWDCSVFGGNCEGREHSVMLSVDDEFKVSI